MKKFLPFFFALLAMLSFSSVSQAQLQGIVPTAPNLSKATGTLAIAHGGSGQTTAPLAQDAFLGASSTGTNPQVFPRYYDVANTGASYIPQSVYGVNLDPKYLTHWRKAVARVNGGSGRGLIVRMGDSTTIGISGIGPGWPNQGDYLAKMLTSGGVPTLQDGFSGDSNAASPGSRVSADTRISAGGWTHTAGITVMGGYVWNASSSVSDLTFTQTAPIDTCKAYYIGGLGGSATVQAGSGSTASLNGGAVAEAVATATTTTVAIQPCTVHWVSTNQVYVGGMLAYDSTTPAIDIIDAGWYGTKTSDWVSTASAWSSLNWLVAVAPDVLILKTNINDVVASTSLATYKANLTAIINAVSSTTDVILETDNPYSPGATVAVQGTYVNALYEVAQASGVPLIDHYSVWGTYTAMNTLGLMADTIHPNTLGYAEQAGYEAKFLLDSVRGGVIAAPKINPAPPETSVTGSTSGTAIFSEPMQGAGEKEVIVYISALLGTASYTFPTKFRQTPQIVTTNGPAAGLVTALSTTAMTITGTTSTGFIELVGN